MPTLVNNPRCDFADALMNDPTPKPGEAVFPNAVIERDVQSEKPWHRLAIMMAASGSTTTEIAEKLDRNVAWVSILLRQTWARKRLTDEITAAGRDEIATLFKSAGPDAVRRIVEISETTANENVKLAANREILDRLLGKSTQRIEATNVVVNVNPAEIDAEIAKLEREESRLLGRN